MEINIQSLHFTANQNLLDFVNEKINKLAGNSSLVESVDVILKVDNSNDMDNKICEIKLLVPGNDLFAKRNARSFEEATSEVVAALQNQLEKLKEKTAGRS
jgi:putative sigma-54 modulation protein